jgi:hypothetical protein
MGELSEVSERVERLDRSMDVILVFLSIVSAAIFQYVTALPYDPLDEAQVSAFNYIIRFSLKLLFLPFLLIVPTWLMVHVTRNENWRMLLRTIVWDLASMTMALNSIALVVFSFPPKTNVLKYPGIIYGVVIVGVAFGLAGLLQVTFFRAYRRALMMDARSPTHDFFFETRWEYADRFTPIIVLLLWSAILWRSLQ